jgi:uncharacterized protein with von Willebrand factor type A (vWA) domain
VKPEDRKPGDRRKHGGLIHSYQKYDPGRFPSPTAPPPDVAGAAFDHMLAFGSTRRLTEEELANAIKLDPSMIGGLGPSLEALIAMLEERKRKILETYDVLARARRGRRTRIASEPTRPRRQLFGRRIPSGSARAKQLRDMENLWYAADALDGDEADRFKSDLLKLRDGLGNLYQIDELVGKYAFTGSERLTIDRAIEVKAELEKIDELLDQLREAMENAQLAVIDMDELREFVQDADVDQLERYAEQVQELIRQEMERQGIEREADGSYRLTPKALRIFQTRLLEEIFSELDAARSGRHDGPIVGEGSVEMPKTRQYEFGDSPAHLDVPQTLTNAVIRDPVSKQVRGEDIVVHETKNNPKCATSVLMDMSGSMRHGGQYVNVKRMALALDGLIRSEYPGDFLSFVEVASFAKIVEPGHVAELMPKPVTIRDPVVRLRADLSDPNISERMIPPHFTNIQRAMQLARQQLGVQDTPNRQIVLITDGLPTAHFEGEHLYLLYPPDPLTEEATMREARLCQREGITINIFLLPSWSQTSEDIGFAHRLAETTGGRVFFTGGDDLDQFVLWDYVSMRRKIIR